MIFKFSEQLISIPFEKIKNVKLYEDFTEDNIVEIPNRFRHIFIETLDFINNTRNIEDISDIFEAAELLNYLGHDNLLRKVCEFIAKNEPGEYGELIVKSLYIEQNKENCMMHYITKNMNITEQIILDNPAIEWYNVTNINPNISLEFVEKYYLKDLPNCINLTEELIEKYPYRDWYWGTIAQSGNISISFIRKHIDKFPNTIEDYKYWGNQWMMLSLNTNFKPQDIFNNLDLPWKFEWLSMNPIFSIKDIKDNINLPWDYTYLLVNSNINYKDIYLNPELNWDRYYIPYIKNFPEEILNLPYPINFDCKNKIIPTLPASYLDCLVESPSITLEIIEKYPDFPWQYNNNISCLPYNPNITPEFIKKHPELNLEMKCPTYSYNNIIRSSKFNNLTKSSKYRHHLENLLDSSYINEPKDNQYIWYQSPSDFYLCNRKRKIEKFEKKGITIDVINLILELWELRFFIEKYPQISNLRHGVHIRN